MGLRAYLEDLLASSQVGLAKWVTIAVAQAKRVRRWVADAVELESAQLEVV